MLGLSRGIGHGASDASPSLCFFSVWLCPGSVHLPDPPGGSVRADQVRWWLGRSTLITDEGSCLLRTAFLECRYPFPKGRRCWYLPASWKGRRRVFMQRPRESLMPCLGLRPSINSLYQLLFHKHTPEVLRRLGDNLVGFSPGCFLGGVPRQAPTATSNTSERSLLAKPKARHARNGQD